MKLHYDRETDSLYIDLVDAPGVEAEEVSDGVVVDLDGNGHIVGVDIEHASERLDLSTLEAVNLPLQASTAG